MPLKQNKKLISTAVIIKNNKFLIAQRTKNDALSELWKFPGKKINQFSK